MRQLREASLNLFAEQRVSTIDLQPYLLLSSLNTSYFFLLLEA